MSLDLYIGDYVIHIDPSDSLALESLLHELLDAIEQVDDALEKLES